MSIALRLLNLTSGWLTQYCPSVVVHSGRAMLRRPLGLSQAALARPSHCGHTLWAHIEVITHNVEVVGTNFFKKVYTPYH